MLKPGSAAPDFSLPDADGNAVTLAGLLNSGPLILYFYPADFTPGCTKEACAIRDIYDDILETGLKVVGISPQAGGSHQRFSERYSLPFTLLCDPEKEVIRAYDLNGPLGIGIRRGTYLINTDKTIADGVLADIAIGKHIRFIENAMTLRHTSDG